MEEPIVPYPQAALRLHEYIRAIDAVLLAVHQVKKPISINRLPDAVIYLPDEDKTLACFICNDMTDYTCIATIASKCAKNYRRMKIDEIAIFYVRPPLEAPSIKLLRTERISHGTR